MKKNIVAVLLSSALASPVVFGGGIPTIDGAAIAQSAQILNEAKNQLKELQDQVKTAKNQLADFQKEAEETKRRLEGYTDFGSYFDSSSAYLKDTLNDVKKDITSKDLSDFFNDNDIKVEDGSGLESIYKAKVEEIKTYERLQDNLTTQAKKMDRLQRDFESATTPQQKQDILNTLQMENLKMDTTLKAVDYELKKQKETQQIKENELQRKYMENEMKTPEIKGSFNLN